MSAGYLEGERLAKVSVWTLVGLGVIEIAVGQFTGSIGLTADGIDSVSDGFVSFLVWLGLKMSRKAPDEKFHFGYYKVESLVAFSTSIGLMGIGGFILYRSYLAFLEPKPLTLPILALAVLLIAGTISTYRALQMRRIAKRYNISSLKLDANNAIKDGSASFLVFFTVLASSLGFHQMDAVGGIVVGVFILLVSYVAIRETTLVLLDAYHSPQLVEEIRRIVESNDGVWVKDVLLRAAGPYVQSEIHIEAEATMTVGRLDEIKSSIETTVKERLTGIKRVVVSTRARPR
ncbi:MAG: cation diffusion facilitator family transporter [Candidatus Bathyarchaeota archaeon]|nr:cation diffusion facilitator family transporter [Candidatus Bathyarchaeota archaeon]